MRFAKDFCCIGTRFFPHANNVPDGDFANYAYGLLHHSLSFATLHNVYRRFCAERASFGKKDWGCSVESLRCVVPYHQQRNILFYGSTNHPNRRVADYRKLTLLLALSRYFQAHNRKVLGRNFYEVDIPLLDTDESAFLGKGAHPYRFLGSTCIVSRRARFSDFLRHIRNIFSDSDWAETTTPDTRQYVLLRTTHCCHCSQHLRRYGHIELAESRGSNNRLFRCYYRIAE